MSDDGDDNPPKKDREDSSLDVTHCCIAGMGLVASRRGAALKFFFFFHFFVSDQLELNVLKSLKKTSRTESGELLDEFVQGSIASQLRGSLDQGKRREKRQRGGRLPMLIKPKHMLLQGRTSPVTSGT